MKIRTGFVSNSSSSSFVVSCNDFGSVFALAIAMIPMREMKDEDRKLVGKIRKALKEGKNTQMPISFSSCNYDTFIWRKGKFFVVKTCNNHIWEREINCVYDPPKKSFGSLDEFSNYCLEMKHKIDFWFPEWDVEGKIVDGEHYCHVYCTKHNRPLLLLKNSSKLFCPRCQKEMEKENEN